MSIEYALVDYKARVAFDLGKYGFGHDWFVKGVPPSIHQVWYDIQEWLRRNFIEVSQGWIEDNASTIWAFIMLYPQCRCVFDNDGRHMWSKIDAGYVDEDGVTHFKIVGSVNEV